MTPEAILAAITAVANAVTEGARVAQTEQGQAAIKRALDNDAAFRDGVKAVGAWFTRLFNQV